MNVQDYSPLISRIRNMISSWTARHLSFGGRLQLIGSVLYSISNFWMSAFRLPKKCIQEINSICSAFLWSGSVLSTQKAKIAWVDVCKTKDEGVLGLKNLSDVNRVTCLKLTWRILSARSSLWVKWIWKYLIRKGSYWSVNERSALGSWMWKKLLKLRPLARQMWRKEVKSGASTSFWFDRWSPLGNLIDLTEGRGTMELGIPINSSVERAIQLYRVKRHRVSTLQLIDDEVVKLRNRGLNQMEDICLWKRENGEYREGFSSSQTWNIIRVHSPNVSWYKGVWFNGATPKFSFLVWIAIHNRLATGDRVLKWNPQAISTCWFCQRTTETRDHLFFDCAYSKEVWLGTIKNLAGNRRFHGWSSVIQVITDGLHGSVQTFLFRYSFQAVAYALWHERNVRRVGESSLPAECLIARLDKLIINRITSLRRKEGKKYEKAMESWFDRD